MTILFRALWWFDALIAAVFLVFFFVGLGDGSVSSFNIVLWLGTLSALAAVLGGGHALRKAGHPGIGIALLSLLALPGVAGVLFLLMILILQPRWN